MPKQDEKSGKFVRGGDHPLRSRAPKYEPWPDVVRLTNGGWTMHDLADAVGSTKRSICRWLIGDSRPVAVSFIRTLQQLPTNPAEYENI